jgi:hypothetical protein
MKTNFIKYPAVAIVVAITLIQIASASPGMQSSPAPKREDTQVRTRAKFWFLDRGLTNKAGATRQKRAVFNPVEE